MKEHDIYYLSGKRMFLKKTSEEVRSNFAHLDSLYSKAQGCG